MEAPAGPGCATHPSLHLRDANDAYIVFEAVRLGLLPLIKRRLTSEEREQLHSGNVFVWEEAEHKGGLERWTDGRRWSQSRMKGEYLFYEEKVETTEEERQAKAARRASRNAGHLIPNVPIRRQDRPAKPNGLTKQTYSTQVYLPGLQSPRKWHIVAYFSGTDYTRLPVVENFESLRRIRIPDGIFFSAKGIVKRLDSSRGDGDCEEEYSAGSSVYSDDFRGQSPPQQYIPKDHTLATHSNSISRYDTCNTNDGVASPGDLQLGPTRSNRRDSGAFPRLSTIAPLSEPGYYPLYVPLSPITTYGNCSDSALRQLSPVHVSASRYYQPLSSEDRRALNTFKVVL